MRPRTIISMLLLVILINSDLLIAQKVSDISITTAFSRFSSASELGGEGIFEKYGFYILSEFRAISFKNSTLSFGLGYSTSAIGGAVTFTGLDGTAINVRSTRIVSQYIKIPITLNYRIKTVGFNPHINLRVSYLNRLRTNEGVLNFNGFKIPTQLSHLYNDHVFRINFGLGYPIKVVKNLILKPIIFWGKDITPSISDDQSNSKITNQIYFSSITIGLKLYVSK